MKYFQLGDYTGPEIGGTFPQSQSMLSTLSVEAPNHIRKVSGKFPDNIYIPDPILQLQAKFTDEISATAFRQPIISGTVKEILSSRRKNGVEYLPVNVLKNGKSRDYWVMNAYASDYQFIDFDRSVVTVENWKDNTKNIITVQDEGEFAKLVAAEQFPELIVIKELYLISNIPEELIFMDHVQGRKFFLSENIVRELEAAGVTGMNFLPLEDRL